MTPPHSQAALFQYDPERPFTAGRLYRGALRSHWPHYVAGTVALLAANVTEVLAPKFVQWCLDIIGGRAVPDWLAGGLATSAQRNEALSRLAVWYGALLAIGLLGRIGWRQFLARRTHVEGRGLKVRMWRVLSGLPLPVFHDYPLGELMNRATGDWNASREIHGFTLVMTLDMLFVTVLALGCMLAIDPWLTLLCLAIFPLLPRRIIRLARRQRDQHVEAQVQLGHLGNRIAQALAAIRLTRATGTDAIWRDRLEADAGAYAARRFQVIRTGWLIYPLAALPTLAAYAILLAVGLGRIKAGTLTVGEFVALQSYVLMLQNPLAELGDCIADWQRGFASFNRLTEIFNLQGLADKLRSRTERPAAAAAGVAVSVQDLSFRHAGAAAEALAGVNLTIAGGEAVGILGPIGSGKSTLLSLLAGLLDPPAGTVRLDGADAPRVTRTWYAEEVALVPQRAFLFAGTLRGNLELGSTYTDEELWQVLELVRLAQDIRALPDGLDARIGEWGVNLSGGQKQRLALARALLRPRRLYLLDDCLSAVDAATEAGILAALRRRIGRSTLIQVAHRASTLAGCDRCYRLEGGRLTPWTNPSGGGEA